VLAARVWTPDEERLLQEILPARRRPDQPFRAAQSPGQRGRLAGRNAWRIGH
jgi:hypothetical protein